VPNLRAFGKCSVDLSRISPRWGQVGAARPPRPTVFSMRIFHCVARLDPASGGPARSVPQLALGLAQQGVEIGLWCPGAVTGALPDLPPEAHSMIRVLAGDFSAALDAFGVPDLVHDHGIWLPCNREVARVCRQRGIPRIVSPRGMLEPWALNHKKWKKRLAWWLYQKRDLQSAVALHATAGQEAEQLRKLGFSQPVIVAANGVTVINAETLKSEKLKKDGADAQPASISAFQRFSVSTFPQKTALFLSRIHPVKGLPLLLDAWAHVKPADWRLRIVGPDEGGHTAELKRLCGELGLGYVEESGDGREETGDRRQKAAREVPAGSPPPPVPCPLSPVLFSGPIEGQAKWELMRAADLFVLPSHSENFGIAVAEALACGVPVITTTGAPWAGLLEHQCGWWVDVNVDALAGALEAAISISDSERREMGQRGVQWMRAEFAWSAIASRIATAYEEVLDSKRQATCGT
jgi:glycosyltransferase involved in cell wall biosynthesis